MKIDPFLSVLEHCWQNMCKVYIYKSRRRNTMRNCGIQFYKFRIYLIIWLQQQYPAHFPMAMLVWQIYTNSITRTDYNHCCRWIRWKTWGWMLLRQMCFWILLASTTSFPLQKRKNYILESIICLKGKQEKKGRLESSRWLLNRESFSNHVHYLHWNNLYNWPM